MKKTLLLLSAMAVVFAAAATMPIRGDINTVIQPKHRVIYTEHVIAPVTDQSEDEDPHMTGWWIVLFDMNEDEVWYKLGQVSNGTWSTTVTLDYYRYGTFYWDPALTDAENNMNRPNVRYYFVHDGHVWCASHDGQVTVMGSYFSNYKNNPLSRDDENRYCYTIPVGFT